MNNMLLFFRFLYQVFPGTPKQSQRLLRQAAKTGDLGTVMKLVRLLISRGQGIIIILIRYKNNNLLYF